MSVIHIGLVEAVWLGVNGFTFLLTLAALVDAWHDLRITGVDDRRRARRLTAKGNVRREGIRTIVQVLLLAIAVPAIFSDREVLVTPGLLLFIAIPVLLFISSAFDAFDRSRLSAMLLTDITTERRGVALEASVQENIELTHKAIERADAAFNEANHSNEKLITLTELVAGKEDKP